MVKLDIKRVEKNINFAKIAYESQIGWDVTDFGKNNFQKEGAVLFCIRNGNKKFKKSTTYCEKLLLLMPNQKFLSIFIKRKQKILLINVMES